MFESWTESISDLPRPWAQIAPATRRFPRANYAVEEAGTTKRWFDLAFSILSLPVVLLVALPIALLIALDGGRPLYRQTRVGRNGRVFTCYKFRTMAHDAGARLQATLHNDPRMRRIWFTRFKLENDSRVTPLGKYLRKTSLDELPQVLNVIRGDMSWVGPRPVTVDELIKYGPDLPAYLACQPGITGWWQVKGRSDTSYQQRVAIDVEYATNWSIRLDLKIILLTVPRVLTAKGCY